MNLLRLLFFSFEVTKTVQGHDGQLFDSTWRHKGKRYLCFTREVHSVNFMIYHLHLYTIMDNEMSTFFQTLFVCVRYLVFVI